MEINMKEYNLESFKEKDLYTWDEIISKFEELESDLKEIKDKYENFKQNVQDNYKQIPIAEQVGVSESDFY